MKRLQCMAAILVAGLWTVPQPAGARRVEFAATLTINAIDGKHDTGTSIDRLNFVPLPLGETDVRYGRTTLHLEGLPALTLAYGDGAGGRQDTQLSIVNIVLRQTLGGRGFIGVGQTVYNQRTSYSEHGPASVESQASRVTGARLEAGLLAPVARGTRLEAVFAVNPAMRGVEYTHVRGPFPLPELRNPERAVQIDTSLRFATRIGCGDFIYGLRYLHYASRYDLRGTTVDGLLADRNVGILPLVGYRLTR